MFTQDKNSRTALLQGTLDLLILRILVFGPQHGQGVARAIQEQSEDVLLVDHGALYPALQRLEAQGWITAKWGVSSNNRKARFYSLTKAGRKQLVHETGHWRKLSGAIARVLGPEAQEG
jgi:PadR family transcriptional regulator, regulatory protein PadR